MQGVRRQHSSTLLHTFRGVPKPYVLSELRRTTYVLVHSCITLPVYLLTCLPTYLSVGDT